MIQRQNGREDQSEGSLLSDRTLLSVSTFISFNWATRVRQSSCEAEVLQVFKTNSLNLLNTAFQYVTQQKIRTEIKGPHILFKAIKVHHISKKDLQDNLLTLCIQTDPRPTHWYKYRFNFFLWPAWFFPGLWRVHILLSVSTALLPQVKASADMHILHFPQRSIL